jgi:hypothetical protein
MTTKTTTTTLAPLAANASKAEEISWLQSMATSLPADSYLLDLLSESMVCWAANQIKDDIAPDAWSLIRSLREEQALATQQHLTDQARINTLQGCLDATSRDLEYVALDAQEQRRAYQESRSQYWNLVSEMDGQRLELEQAQTTIQALKVKLFDLEHPELA